MERKIGDIFEIDGEWYQCVKSIVYCPECAFNQDFCSSKVLRECNAISRFDGNNIVFMKLEKVGEPYKYFVQHKGIVTLQPYKLFTTPIINGVVCNVNYDTNTIDLEIKQNKEDMEMRKVFMNGDDRDYLLDRLENILHDNHCLEYKDEICNSFCKYITSNNRELKPFNLEAAKAGKPVCTRDGHKARIICFDRRLFYKNVSYPILALVERSDGEDDVCGYNEKGKVLIEDGAEYKDDLMMLSEKKEGWVNVYYDNDTSSHRGCRFIYDTKERAVKEAGSAYITTIKINWEE